MSSVVVIDYGSGNLHSVHKALEAAAASAGQSVQVRVTSDPDVVRAADRVVLPGVGAFAECRRGLDAVDGLLDALTEVVKTRGRPFFGVCVGMQLLATRGLEYEVTDGLDWISGDVAPIRPSDPSLKIPHMGWNTLTQARPHPLLDSLLNGSGPRDAYFVHSYALTPANPEDLVATTDYGGPITAFVARDNIAGSQFHPEKSQAFGLALLSNFIRWRP